MTSVRPCWLMLVLLAGCSSRTVSNDAGMDGPPWTDGPPGVDMIYDRDRGIPDQATPRDTFPPDADPCYCPPGQVWLRSSCVPTVKLGCGPTCDPATPGSCPPGETCDPWAAAPWCMSAAAVPACVPTATTGPITGPLRFSPLTGVAGQSVTITVEGAAFYVGALFYNIRIGSEVKMEMNVGNCAIKASFTPPSPGAYAVEVSQYGGGSPWVLAGFYIASGGSIPMPTIQPGYPCPTNPAPGDPACIQGGSYSCTCVGGRCQCN